MNSRKGFSVVEMLVAVALFTAVVLMSIAAMMALVDANYKTRSVRTAMDNLGFIIDDMARDLRVGSRYLCKEGTSPGAMTVGTDATGVDCPYVKNNPDKGGEYLAFRNKDNNVVFYYFDDSVPASPILKKKVTTTLWSAGYADNFTSGTGLSGADKYATLSSSDITISRFRFYVYNTIPYVLTEQNTAVQPYIVISATVTVGPASRPKSQTTFSIQTTVSQRIPHNVD